MRHLKKGKDKSLSSQPPLVMGFRLGDGDSGVWGKSEYVCFLEGKSTKDTLDQNGERGVRCGTPCSCVPFWWGKARTVSGVGKRLLPENVSGKRTLLLPGFRPAKEGSPFASPSVVVCPLALLQLVRFVSRAWPAQ